MPTKPHKPTLSNRLGALPWWAVLLAGVAVIALGVMLLVSPKATSEMLFRAVGVLALIGGFVTIVSLLFNRVNWGWKLFGGALAIVCGYILISQPLGSAYLFSAIVLWMVATAIIIAGVALIIQGIAYAGWGHTILGILGLLFGGLLILSIAVGTLVMPWLFGIAGIAGGIAAIVDAFRIRGRRKAEAGVPVANGPASAAK